MNFLPTEKLTWGTIWTWTSEVLLPRWCTPPLAPCRPPQPLRQLTTIPIGAVVSPRPCPLLHILLLQVSTEILDYINYAGTFLVTSYINLE